MAGEKPGETIIKIGISACLLGQKVRHDGGHKHDRFITDILGRFVRFVPVCPEVEVGMSTAREAVRLEGDVSAPRMVGVKSRDDWTGRMNTYCAKRMKRLEKANLSGYILKKDSPSCGMWRVRLYSKGVASKIGRGLYADSLIESFPLLQVEEEGRLNDPRLRENFIVRVFAYYRLNNLFTGRFSRRAVVEFHTASKYLLLAHSPKHYKQLGQLVAAIDKYKPSDFWDKYSTLYVQALSVKTTVRKNFNVMHHILGFLRKHLTDGDKKCILDLIEDYRRELVPLIVPVTLIRHHIYKYNIDYIMDQLYLSPDPKELMLRNHV
ncbi:MAG: DUF523 and DUF1722 domain-containing protein [Candidatus Zixiibacteriota bacterium]|nr:MAG: DUF523 and DUF1722 domain-containing protein [candidate division Zixibacteria bacterium]